MATSTPHSNSESTAPTESQIEAMVDQAEEMIWMLLDGRLPDAGCKRLEQMLFEHERVRRRYLECVQIHVDLHDLLGRDARPEQIKDQPPILGLLGSPLAGDLPMAGDLPPTSPS